MSIAKKSFLVSVKILLFSFVFIGIFVCFSMWSDWKFTFIFATLPMISAFVLGRITGDKKVYLSDILFLLVGFFCVLTGFIIAIISKG